MSANTSANTPCHPHPLLCVPRVELRLRVELLVVDRLLLVLFLLLLFLRRAHAPAVSVLLLLLQSMRKVSLAFTVALLNISRSI